MLYCDGAADTAYDVLCLPQSKVCTGCKIEKPFDCFYKHREGRFGLNPKCKSCTRVDQSAGRYRLYQKAYREKTKEHQRVYQQAYRAINRERAAEYGKHYRSDPKNVEKEKRRSRARYTENKVEMKAKSQALYAMNRRNPEWVALEREKARLREADRRRTSPSYRLQCSVRTLIRISLKRNSSGPVGGQLRHLSYDMADLRSHLERQFKPRMNWENYGRSWHVDHIVPVCSFPINVNDPSKCPEFQACWALSNLRPLWRKANLKKQAKRLFLI